VPESERERIFERFQRGSATGGRSGFGLGLAIGRELASRMDGTLALLDAGEATGKGASFIVSLPATHMDNDQEDEAP
jgi:signal transduction histidine kinase